MKNFLPLLIFASLTLTVSGRVGEQDTTHAQFQRRLCGKERDGCFSWLTDPCCDGYSCDDIRQECYPFPRREGDPCLTLLDQCDEGLTCDGVMRGKCRTVGTRVDDKCSFARPCSDDESLQLTCDLFTNKCRKPGTVGDTCHTSRPCADGLSCQIGSQRCRVLGEEGDLCSATQRCGDGLACDLQEQRCRGRSGVNEKCHITRFCEDKLFCDLNDQVCKTAAGSGNDCNMYVPCVSGLECDDGTCRVPPEVPDKCKLGAPGCPGENTDGDDTDTGSDGGTDPLDNVADGPLPCPLTNPDCNADQDLDSDVQDDPNGGISTNGDDLGQQPDDTDCIRNMSTGECIPESPAPSASPTESPTTPIPTTSPAPSTESPTASLPTPSPTTAAPTETSTQKCRLTGCPENENEVSDTQKFRKVPSASYEWRPKIADDTRGGAAGSFGGARRYLVEDDVA